MHKHCTKITQKTNDNHMITLLPSEAALCTKRDTSDSDFKKTMKRYVNSTLPYVFS